MMPNRRQFLKAGIHGLAGVGLAGLSTTQQLMAQSASSRYGIVGQRAPELEISYWIDSAGKPTYFNLAAHQNKWVFLKCFQSWCPGCHSHGLPAVKKISEALKGNPNIVFAGIQTVFEGHSTNTVEKVRETQLQYDLQFPMGHDPGSENNQPKTMFDYRTGGTPWMIIINPQRVVVYNDFNINADKAIEYLRAETA